MKAHVGAHAAAHTRQNGLGNAKLYINRKPCESTVGCNAMLPRMLPPGAELTVFGPDDFVKTYRGFPEE